MVGGLIVLTNRTDEQSPSSTQPVVQDRRDWKRDNRSNVLDSVEQTQRGALRVVEVVFPLVKRLKTVHHRTVVTIAHRRENEEELLLVRVVGVVQSCHVRTHNDQVDSEQIPLVPRRLASTKQDPERVRLVDRSRLPVSERA